MREKILITGGAGMIGCVLSRYFLNKSFDIVILDNLSGGFKDNIPLECRFFEEDICNHNGVDEIFSKEKPDYVIHCAAYAAEILSPFIRRFNYSNNLVGSINIINSCINHNVKKIINFSSFATYGAGIPPFKETDLRIPKDPYGIAKLAVEQDLQEASDHFNLKYSTVLPHNVISKYQNYWDIYRNAIAIWIRQCANKEDITIFGDGTQTRAFSDCKFLCDPIEKLLYDHHGEVYNIGSDNPVTIKDAANMVLKIAEQFGLKQSKLIFLEQRKEVVHAYCDHSKAKKELGFEDNTNLESVIKEMFEYMLSIPEKMPQRMKYEINRNMYSYWK